MKQNFLKLIFNEDLVHGSSFFVWPELDVFAVAVAAVVVVAEKEEVEKDCSPVLGSQKHHSRWPETNFDNWTSDILNQYVF